jgi:trigger factor
MGRVGEWEKRGIGEKAKKVTIMEVRIEKPKSYIREMHISVPAERYEKEKQRIARSYRAGAEIPGFRKGKAPVSLVVASFKKEIEKEARENIVREAFSQAVREHNLNPITYAHIENFTDSDVAGFITFSARFQVIPDFELSLEGLETAVKPVNITDKKIGDVLDGLKEGYTTVRPVSRPSREGDAVEFDYVVFDENGNEIDAAQGMVVDCGKGDGKASMGALLMGVKPGQRIEGNVIYPPTFPLLELDGKQVRMELEIKEVKEKVVPEMNDELAKTLGMNSMTELKDSVRRQLEEEQETIARAEARERMVEKLLKRNVFEVPEALLRYPPGESGDETNSSENRERLLELAERRARFNIILDRVAELKQVKVPEEEISVFLEREATRESVDPQRLRTYLVQTGKMRDIIAMFKREKVFDEMEKEFLKKG